MRTIAKILGMSALEQEIRSLEKGKNEEKSSILESEKFVVERSLESESDFGQIKEREQQHPKESKRARLLLKFWEELLALQEGKISVHSKVKPTERGSLSLGSNKGLSYYYVIIGNKSRIDFYISRPNESDNKRIFNELFSHKDEIEDSFGAPLIWQPLDDKRDCRIRYVMEIVDFENSEYWLEIQTEMIDAMSRLEKALSPFIAKLN